MLFFYCTSVFHIFIILYCMRNRYNIEKDKAIILIPEHVESLVEKVPKIKELGFVKDVYLVNSDLSYEEIDKKLSDVAIKENDTVHMIGWSRLGLWLNRLGTVKRTSS